MNIELLLISLLAGVLTGLAPCILPLLPVIVGGSLSGEASLRRAFTIVASLGVSVFAFTLILKASTAFITIPALFWQMLSGGLLIFFGIVTLFPALWDKISVMQKIYQSSNALLGTGFQKQSVWGDVIMGAALGPVFSSCSPTYFVILAAVLPAHFAIGLLYLFAYVSGLCAFLFLVAFLGQRAVVLLGIASDPSGWFKKSMGMLFIVVGFAIIFGLDKKLEVSLPAGAFGEVGLEQRLLGASGKASRYGKAPELVQPDGFINTGGQPITLAQYVGKKVVLVDFWDYSCINCQRTFPYLTAWYAKYKDQGLEIVGVHTPEFAFEHSLANVEAAAQRFGLTYPIVLDNEYKTWGAFQNQYWPRDYLIDIDGYIVYDHAGEGDYSGTENAIRQALMERAQKLGIATSTAIATALAPEAPMAVSTVAPQDLSAIQSPETYFGSNRNEYLGNGTPGESGSRAFVRPSATVIAAHTNTLYLTGNWNITPEYAEASTGASIIYRYNSRDVYMVATNPHTPVKIKVFRDGVPVGAFAGSDVNAATSEAVIEGDRLYTLIHDAAPGEHTIEIRIEDGTLDAYTFTFG